MPTFLEKQWQTPEARLAARQSAGSDLSSMGEEA
jgi:hypothetical protein